MSRSLYQKMMINLMMIAYVIVKMVKMSSYDPLDENSSEDENIQEIEDENIEESEDENIDIDEHEDHGSIPTGRGPSWLPNINRCRSEGHLIPVEYNERGQLVGTGRVSFASMLGSTVRRIVSILHENWFKVPKEDKTQIWEIMKSTFKLQPQHKKQFLQQARKRYKDYKTNLTREHVHKKLEKKPGEFPPTRPRGYEGVITQEDWIDSGVDRIKGEDASSSCKNEYNHHLSRGGYQRARELLGDKAAKLDRADLWALGRKNKKGELDGNASQVKERIDHYRQLEVEGKWEPEGSDDVLTMALGNLETRGYVRGVGYGVTPTQYFHTPQPTSEKEKGKKKVGHDDLDRLMHEQEEQIRNEYEDRFRQQEELVKSMLEATRENPQQQSYSGSTYVPEPPQQHVEDFYVPMSSPVDYPLSTPQERKCRLALGSIDHIVAFALQVETGESTIHTLPLAGLYCRVIIKHALNPVALIPKSIPEAEVFTIVQAIGVPISWPKNLIIYDDWTDEELLLSNPNQTKKSKSKRSMTQPKTQIQSREKRPKKGSLTQNIQPELLPHNLRAIYEIVSTWPKGEVADVIISNAVFHEDMMGFFIEKDDIFEFLAENKIGQGVICCYLSYLYTWLVNNNRQHLWMFVNPNQVAILTTKHDDRVSFLVEIFFSLVNQQQFMVVPWNHGKHWVCAILVPQAYHVYYLDPLNAPITNRPIILKTIKEAYDTYLMRRSMEIPKNLSIKELVCPHQPSNIECGYYVMRMIKELVQSPNRRDYIKKELIDKKPYPKAMIDEMREEWATYMLPHLQSHRIMGH
ncbi:hypothetical protein G4B88_025253 [Cannabis sativa]|uniref:Ubiquitin-like protease family profile domain-containing protein n=1 Tax=Cannabis sativa TaxID=3483 RepID=A0A7J6HSA2_CANSA|nr:hypothetical protein G4B88_025253 [Cannabis sativa]